MTAPTPLVDLIIPVLNEVKALEKSVETVRAFLGKTFPYRWRVTIADNGSTDGTRDVGEMLQKKYPGEVFFFAIPQRGRGRALRLAWTQSPADIMAYTDVDLSTELEALEVLCRAIHEQGFDLGTGSRLQKTSRVKRGPKREFISRCYNLMVKGMLFTHFSDAQCGFKAVSREVVEKVVPHVEDQAWFFDTELLSLAEKQGYRIKDHPVLWIDDEDSRVKIVKTAWEDIKGLVRVRFYLWSSAFRATRAEWRKGSPSLRAAAHGERARV
ncbi:MAG: glycosyltransferase family 2 protein [Planctomycetes bacterium]|nr:glycosyltransferase family 2 protein [Planctomycetota bacterium]